MIGLAYALKGEIRSILKTMNPKLLETVSGVAVYELEPGLLAYLGEIFPDTKCECGLAGKAGDYRRQSQRNPYCDRVGAVLADLYGGWPG